MRALVRARPPVAERETRIASRFREQLWQATMIDETNLSGRDLLANPVRGDLIHEQGKRAISVSSNQRAKAGLCAPSHDHNTHLVGENLVISRLKPAKHSHVRDSVVRNHHRKGVREKRERIVHTVRRS